MFKVILFSVLFSLSANANVGLLSPDYLTLKTVTVKELNTGRSVTSKIEDIQTVDLSTYVNREIGLDQIINFGEKLWEIVKANEPVLEFNTKSAMAIPKAASSPENLDGWDAPVSKDYQVTYTNYLNMDVVKFHYKVIFTPQGSYNGRGQYLANASVHPVDISVSIGYKFNALVEIGQLLNVGSSGNPVAGMQININWDVNTILKKNKGGDYYFAQGDGELTVL